MSSYGAACKPNESWKSARLRECAGPRLSRPCTLSMTGAATVSARVACWSIGCIGCVGCTGCIGCITVRRPAPEQTWLGTAFDSEKLPRPTPMHPPSSDAATRQQVPAAFGGHGEHEVAFGLVVSRQLSAALCSPRAGWLRKWMASPCRAGLHDV
jgi:hypothetical protein